ncbi:aminoacyl-tRNA hydrolase [Candidatus Gottesmanbacteria bacterium]|nr:aminoacyl-tRNA hydrolase [Candidatus Gottesmanbacteria bacterium]
MKLIAGLGNPGEKFATTRHNIGFMVIDKFVKERLSVEKSLKAWKNDKKFVANICNLDDLIVVKPQSYMNLSGLSVMRVANFYKVKMEDIWVVHDDIDLPLGKIRIRKGGASAGHNGIESIIKNLGESNFVRFRLGIGKGKLDKPHTADHNLHQREIEKFVIAPFTDHEAGELKKMIKYGVLALEIALEKGLDRAMNRFN